MRCESPSSPRALIANKTSLDGDDRASMLAYEYVRPGNRRTVFDARLLQADGKLVVFTHVAHPSKPLYHGGHPVIESGYSVVWFLFQREPYDVGCFYRPDGTLTGYYVDILEPVHWQEENPPRLTPLVDLALDIWIAPDGSYQVLDEDEFALFVRRGDLTARQADHARATLTSVISLVDAGDFPPSIVKDYASHPPAEALPKAHGSKELHNIDPKRDCR